MITRDARSNHVVSDSLQQGHLPYFLSLGIVRDVVPPIIAKSLKTAESWYYHDCGIYDYMIKIVIVIK